MLRIAKILKSNGTDGGVLVSAPEYELETIQEPVYIIFDGLPVPFFILDCTPKGSVRYILHLNDVNSLSDAEELVGRDIFLEDEDEQDTRDEDFTGWTLLDKGVPCGTISGLEPIPGNPCLYLDRPDGTQILVPLHEDLILSADPASRTLNLNLPEGLW